MTETATTTKTDDKALAQEILNQLGGNRFIAMTGAKNLMATRDAEIDNGNEGAGLAFKLPNRFAKNGINFVSIKLNSMDLYDMTFSRVTISRKTGFKQVIKATETGLYNDMIQAAFTEHTGLNTAL